MHQMSIANIESLDKAISPPPIFKRGSLSPIDKKSVSRSRTKKSEQTVTPVTEMSIKKAVKTGGLTSQQSRNPVPNDSNPQSSAVHPLSTN